MATHSSIPCLGKPIDRGDWQAMGYIGGGTGEAGGGEIKEKEQVFL